MEYVYLRRMYTPKVELGPRVQGLWCSCMSGTHLAGDGKQRGLRKGRTELRRLQVDRLQRSMEVAELPRVVVMIDGVCISIQGLWCSCMSGTHLAGDGKQRGLRKGRTVQRPVALWAAAGSSCSSRRRTSKSDARPKTGTMPS
jgi:hypothetical protein